MAKKQSNELPPSTEVIVVLRKKMTLAEYLELRKKSINKGGEVHSQQINF